MFRDELGCAKDIRAKIIVNLDTHAKFYRPRTVPFSLREKIDKELERLEAQGVIEPVLSSEWATPIVPIVKGDGSVRICGDYKITVNISANVDACPLPRADDLFASLSGDVSFSKLDLAHAYLQIPLKEQSKKYTNVTTHKGLFQYNRLPFGLSSAPAIFQRTMKSILQGLPRVCVYLYDKLITGSSEEEHLTNLKNVLKRLEQSGYRLKKGKCSFLLSTVEYLGHIITPEGLKPMRRR